MKVRAFLNLQWITISQNLLKITGVSGYCSTLFNDVTRDSIANNFVIDVYCRCLEILCQIALRSVANYFRSYTLLQLGIKSVGIYSRQL